MTPPGKCNVEGCHNQAAWMVTFGDRTKDGPLGFFGMCFVDVVVEDHKGAERSKLE